MMSAARIVSTFFGAVALGASPLRNRCKITLPEHWQADVRATGTHSSKTTALVPHPIARGSLSGILV
jgi:hypothetical protein